MGDDVVVALEDAVREVVVPEELPDVLDGIEFGRSRRKRQQVMLSGTLRPLEICHPARSRIRTAWGGEDLGMIRGIIPLTNGPPVC
jgi:hypothetical protein